MLYTKMGSEIGSEFWDVPTEDDEITHIFPQDTKWYLSGRVALKAIISDILAHYECRTVGIPSWCCDSMVKPFLNAGIEVLFYPVYWDKGLIQEISLDNDVLFLMDYFGYTGSQPDLNGFDGVVIRDVTHSLFSHSYFDSDYYFGSLRKWCGVWTGGFAWTKDGHRLAEESECENGYVALRKRAMEEKAEYIKGKRDDKDYLKVFYEAEKLLENAGIVPAAERDVELAQRIDVESIKIRRRANSEVLRCAFPDWLIFPSIASEDAPMFVPVLVPDGKRDDLRRYLIQNEIFCPVHWPLCRYHRIDEQAMYIYQNELSLVCDQRYTGEDMDRIVDTINAFWKEA